MTEANELIEAMYQLEMMLDTAAAIEDDELCTRAWACLYLVQRARYPDYNPDNYDEVLQGARALDDKVQA